MNLLIGVIAQLLHIALMAAAAPTLVGLCDWVAARLAGRQGPPVLQPWRDMARLLRKQPVMPESASLVTEFAPLVATAATAVAAILVPSFALDMTFARFADLLLIGGLLALARASLALAALDAGTAPGGMGASRAMLLACVSEPALLLAVFSLGLLAGSLNVDLIAAMQQDLASGWRTGSVLVLAALLLVGLADTGVVRREAVALEFSGVDLALIQATEALRLLLWFDLIGALFLPFGMASPDAGLVAWPIGLLCWVARLALFAVAAAVARVMLGRLRMLRVARMLGVAMLLGLLAIVVLFAGMGTV